MSEEPGVQGDAFDDAALRVETGGEFILDLEGFEGPLDLLLTLARDQKVDLTRISILQLANQYLDFIAQARGLKLEIAADYLVMAAWLAYLKSRLLLPEKEAGEKPTGEQMAAALAHQLRRLEAMREAGVRLLARPRLGRDVFPRGAPEPIPVVRRSRFDLSLYDLLKGYSNHRLRIRAGALRILPSELYSIDAAMARLTARLGEIADWEVMTRFLPPELAGGLIGRSAVASTLAAALELARQGKLKLKQLEAFGPIYLRGVKEAE